MTSIYHFYGIICSNIFYCLGFKLFLLCRSCSISFLYLSWNHILLQLIAYFLSHLTSIHNLFFISFYFTTGLLNQPEFSKTSRHLILHVVKTGEKSRLAGRNFLLTNLRYVLNFLNRMYIKTILCLKYFPCFLLPLIKIWNIFLEHFAHKEIKLKRD